MCLKKCDKIIRPGELLGSKIAEKIVSLKKSEKLNIKKFLDVADAKDNTNVYSKIKVRTRQLSRLLN